MYYVGTLVASCDFSVYVCSCEWNVLIYVTSRRLFLRDVCCLS